MKCYYYGSVDHKPTLDEGLPGTCFLEMLEAKNIAATPRLAAALKENPAHLYKSIGIDRSPDFEGCFKLKRTQGAAAAHQEEGFLVFTANTVKFSDGCFDGPHCEVIWQRTEEDQACTAMLVKNMTTEEFEETFGGQVEFMYP